MGGGAVVDVVVEETVVVEVVEDEAAELGLSSPRERKSRMRLFSEHGALQPGHISFPVASQW
jgi:hypothetical protein